jgi:branched-chain amino acid transport system ATP-binding protein
VAEPLLAIRGLTKHFGGVLATDDIDLDIAAGETRAVIGPNGAGKTTLIAQLAGELRSDAGTIRFDGRDLTQIPGHARAALGLARSFQVTSIFRSFTALDNVVLAAQARRGHSFRFWRPVRARDDLIRPAREALEQVGLAQRADTSAAQLAHGEHRQLEIAMALVSQPKLLLLDEPTAGMSPEETQRMVRFLGTLKGRITMLLVEHDMDAVFSLADRITVLVQGKPIATGLPAEIRGNKRVREAYLGEDFTSQ